MLMSIVYLFILTISCSFNNIVFVYSYSDESECLKSAIDTDFTNHVVLAMKRGYWECAKNALQSSSEVSKIEFRNHFDVNHRMILQELTALKSHIDSYQPMAVVSPAFQWAQSTTELFLNVKFSHKIDAPATLNVEATNVTILNNQLILEATDSKKVFRLDLMFYKPIQPNETKYEMASVGRMTFTFKKDISPSKWSQLLDMKSLKSLGKKSPTNMHKWFHMQEKYDSELDKLEDDDDGDNDDDDETTGKSKQASKSKKSPAASTSSTSTVTETSAGTETQSQDEKNETVTELETTGTDTDTIVSTTTPNQDKILSIQNETKEKLKQLKSYYFTTKKEIEKLAKEEIDRLEAEDKKASEAAAEPKAGTIQPQDDTDISDDEL